MRDRIWQLELSNYSNCCSECCRSSQKRILRAIPWQGALHRLRPDRSHPDQVRRAACRDLRVCLFGSQSMTRIREPCFGVNA